MLERAVLIVVVACWLAIVVFFFFVHKRPAKAQEKKRDKTWLWGLAVEVLAYVLVWNIHRPYFTPMLPLPRLLEITLGIATMILALASVWLWFAATLALGQHWTCAARTIQGHRLVTHGPYRLVRNPLYLGMFGMLLASGLAVSQWWALLIGTVIFLIGNSVRVRAEEKLLRESFGDEFETYARRVPAMFPRLFG